MGKANGSVASGLVQNYGRPQNGNVPCIGNDDNPLELVDTVIFRQTQLSVRNLRSEIFNSRPIVDTLQTADIVLADLYIHILYTYTYYIYIHIIYIYMHYIYIYIIYT